MATITEIKTKNGEVRFKVRVRIKGYEPATATFRRKTDAKSWVQQTEAAMREGRYFTTNEARKHRVGDLIDRYLLDVLPQKSKIMKEKQGVQYRWWKDQLGHVLLSHLTPALIGEKRDLLARTPVGKEKKLRATSTVNRYLAALSHALSIAASEWGWLESSPMEQVRNLKEPKGRVRYLDDLERKALLDACQKSDYPDLYAIVVLALSTGGRYAEIMGLKWKNVDLVRQVVQFETTKNGESRSVGLRGEALRLLQAKSKIRHIRTTLLFPGQDGKKPYFVRRPWWKALEEAGIEDFRFHDLRHSAASYLAMNGASLLEIAEILGHKTLQMVKRYAHLAESHTANVVERMNREIFG